MADKWIAKIEPPFIYRIGEFRNCGIVNFEFLNYLILKLINSDLIDFFNILG